MNFSSSEWRQHILGAFLVSLLVSLFVVFVAVMFSGNCEERISSLLGLAGHKHETLTFIGLGMGGLVLALQALIANRRAKAMEGAAQAQADANKQAERGLRQERLKNAIEHLGQVSASVRLGAAYELFHLAGDTPSLRQTVLDILCAHIRQTTSEDSYQETYKESPSEEVQTLLTLLFVQEHTVFKGIRIDLKKSYLHGADLSRARLNFANLSDANMRKSQLSGAHLMGSDLGSAKLVYAWLDDTQLQGANLNYANLLGASLSRTKMQGAILIGTRLYLSEIFHVNLQGACLAGARFQAASFSEVSMKGVTSAGIFSHPFAESMRGGIGRNSDFSRVFFGGRLHVSAPDSLLKDVDDHDVENFRAKLELHLGKPASHEPPTGKVITGAYTEEDAKQWIKDYKAATARDAVEGDS